jgi:hypothetical protein
MCALSKLLQRRILLLSFGRMVLLGDGARKEAAGV